MYFFRLHLLVGIFLLSISLPNYCFSEKDNIIQATVLSNYSLIQISPSQTATLKIGVLFNIPKGWHIYWKNSGDSGLPTTLEFELPDSWIMSEIKYPVPYSFKERGGIKTIGYEDEVLIFADFHPPQVELLKTEKSIFNVKANWLACKDSCIPENMQDVISIELSARTNSLWSSSAQVFDKYESLVPKSINVQHAINDVFLSFFEYKPIYTEFNHLKPEVLTLYFKLNSFVKPISIATNIQFFPDKQENVIYDSLSVSSAYIENKNQAVLRMPIIPQNKQDTLVNISGIFVLSKELFNTKQDIAIEWRTDPDWKLNTPSSANSLSFAEPFYPLIFRTKTYVEDSSILAIKTESYTNLDYINKALIFILAMLFAFLGGLVLNFMPCVLPVIAVKVYSLLNEAQRQNSSPVKSSLAYALGIIASMLTLAISLIIARSYYNFDPVWGIQFQSSIFIFTISFILFVFALGLFDLYTISIPNIALFQNKVFSVKTPLYRNFFEGILTTALSTPCSAPFLGTALVFAFAQSNLIILSSFFFIGLGLSLPYVLLASNPKLLKFLPKSGEWMIKLKQFFGFMLLATVLWLLNLIEWVTQTIIIEALGLFLTFVFAVWIYKLAEISKNKTAYLLCSLISLMLIIYSTALFFNTKLDETSEASQNTIAWKEYSETSLLEASANKQAVFIDFTAKWCLTCKANELLVIETKEVQEEIKKHKILALKADLTNGSQTATEALKRFGGGAVPYYVIIPADQTLNPIVLPTILTKDSLLRTLREKASALVQR